MRSFAIPVLLAAATAVALPAHAQLKLPRPSPGASSTQTLGLTELSVKYSRPGVKGRKIWGELVPLDKPWRTGANEATTFTTDGEVQFGGKKLAAGTYAVVTIPGKDEWTIALNSDKEMWGNDGYDPKKDVLRVTAKPAAAEHQEWMSIGFDDLTNNSTNLVLRWEKLKVAVPITADVNSQGLANARAAMASLKSDDWLTAYQAASFTLNNDVSMDEGEKWLAKSLAIQENHINLNLQARWHAKAGRKAEAIAAGEKAIAKGKAAKEPADVSGTERLVAEWKASK